MDDRNGAIERIALAALDLESEPRTAFIERECAGDASLRAAVEAWLRDHEAAASFLETPALALGSGDAAPSRLASELAEGLQGFRLIRELGRGGMGVVYMAEQQRPRRVVALKILRPDFVADSALRRFEHEAQVLARLQHPGIAQIYEVGVRADGLRRAPFFAMEYIPGAALITDYADEHRLDTRQRLELFARVCDAVEHGHLKGVVHRDLKPGNILVDASGNPKVIDFGVARATDSDLAVTTMRTDVGLLIGTLRYMSPEQCGPESHDIDTRSDVYALGVVLYELLTGKPPYELDRVPMHEACRIIRDQSPTRPGTLRRALRGDLETITLKALEKDRERRYKSAGDLAADVRRFLGDEPIVARPASAVYQLLKFTRRNKALVGGVVGIMLALAAGAAVAVVFAIGQTRESEKARAITNAIRSSLYRRQATEVNRARHLVEHLEPDERPTPDTRTALWLDNHQPVTFYDQDGNATLELSTKLSVPDWVGPTTSGASTFRVDAAIHADIDPDHPGRELIVAMCHAPINSYSVVRIYDGKLNVIRELWSPGYFRNIYWHAPTRLLVVSGHLIQLGHYVPELASYASAGCPRDRRNPQLAIAIDPAKAHGVLFPLAGDEAHPPADAEWMLVCEPPGTLDAEIKALDAPLQGSASAFGSLHVMVRRTWPESAPNPVTDDYVAHVAADGARLEPFRLLTGADGDAPASIPDNMLVIRDISLRARAKSIAEPILLELGSEGDARRRVEGDPTLAPDLRRCALDALTAMLANWRWLNCAAGAIAEHPPHSPEEYAKALDWAQLAVELHDDTCSAPERCDSTWYTINTLGIALYRVSRFEEAIQTLERARTSWAAARAHDTPERPEDLAYLAMAAHRLGRTDDALDYLDLARRVATPGDAEQTLLLREASQVLADR